MKWFECIKLIETSVRCLASAAPSTEGRRTPATSGALGVPEFKNGREHSGQNKTLARL
jgi:hypothetical protein